MKIEIDQSGKVENTSKPTVVAFSNSTQGSVIISAIDKRKIHKLFREINESRVFAYKTFALLVFVLLRGHIKKTDQIVIDREYHGHEKLIKQYILELAQKHNYKIDPKNIHFKEIGKKSRAHIIALHFYKKGRAEIKINYNDFLKLVI